MVARHYQNKIVQRHFQAGLSQDVHSTGKFLLFILPQQNLPLNFQWKTAISTLCCCRPSGEQRRGKDAQQPPTPMRYSHLSFACPRRCEFSAENRLLRQIPCPAALCCLARGVFVLKKDIFPFLGNIYSGENEPNAEEAWGELHNGGEASPLLLSSASRALGIPTSLGAQDHIGKASQS